ncbi:MAG: RES family NAD+ phosphorylase [Bacteroidetes bacterium]|nr:RES family NAD+ phosphorylase [Bacteroidota bacterium]
MELFRIAEEKYASDLIASGIAGRWNDDNEFVIYTASSRALGTLEKVIRFQSIHPKVVYKVMVIFIPDNPDFITEVKIGHLPSYWREVSAYPELKAIGTDWYNKRKSLVLKVPSSIITKEFNFLINTEHPDFGVVKLALIGDYFFDERLLSMNSSGAKASKSKTKK